MKIAFMCEDLFRFENVSEEGSNKEEQGEGFQEEETCKGGSAYVPAATNEEDGEGEYY